MNIIHDLYDNDSLDCLMTRAYIIYQVVGQSDRTHIEDGRTQEVKEITMHANGHTTVWGTPISVGRAPDGQGWYQQLKAWWAAQQAARHDATLATLSARWNARREVVTPFRAEAAPEMAAAHRTLSVATMLYGLAC
jgi:hypothetical protein